MPHPCEDRAGSKTGPNQLFSGGCADMLGERVLPNRTQVDAKVDSRVITRQPSGTLMDALRTLILVLHVSSAALLIGVPAGMTRNLKAHLAIGGKAFEAAALDAVKRGRITGISSLVTLGSGITLIMMAGGMGAVSLNFHIALTTMLVAVIMGMGFMRPTGVKLHELSQKDPLDKDAATGLIKKLAMGTGIMHLLWVITLTLMFVRIYK